MSNNEPKNRPTPEELAAMDNEELRFLKACVVIACMDREDMQGILTIEDYRDTIQVVQDVNAGHIDPTKYH